ncbi:Uroporphyrinogen-III C-methyltransferase [Nakaseomyces bracarensis]|uniref:Uroporphyrinogen-III C-methyltransferase n=1 Tax=Nakaseomyces bracarensis TaxID=273131 RepID=A0ABR4NRH5_9SACH
MIPLITANVGQEVSLVIGTGSSIDKLGLVKNRVRTLLSSGGNVVVVNASFQEHWKQLEQEFAGIAEVRMLYRDFQLPDLTTLGRSVVSRVVDRVFVNLPLEQDPQLKHIYNQCVKMRIPINTFHRPEFSTFNMIPTYVDPKGSGLQIAVTTCGQGYLLANRIKREIVSHLPANISDVVINMGKLKDHIINEDMKVLIKEKYMETDLSKPTLGYGLDEDGWESHKFNRLIHEFDMTEREQREKRVRWLSQVMEYYPLTKLADITMQDLEGHSIKATKSSSEPKSTLPVEKPSTDGSTDQHIDKKVKIDVGTICKKNQRGTISLVGSGPGSLSMLTLGALNEIKTADVILTDKLVPQTVLDIIPKDTETFTARKFPGNAERAQEELLQKGLEYLAQGKKVVRLKQGDPYIFGRGGEEFNFFSNHGYEPAVLPGISSALAATVVSKIPATQRAVADQVLICTGTGRKGALPQVPEYVSTRTTVFLMALHRVDTLVKVLLEKSWDPEVLVAVVERASCPDQRITRTKLKYLTSVVEEIGSRPPGLLVIGNATGVLLPEKSVTFNESCKYHIDEGYRAFELDTDYLIPKLS